VGAPFPERVPRLLFDPRDANDALGLPDPLSLARAVTRGALVEIELLRVPIFDGFDPEATELIFGLAYGLVVVTNAVNA